MENLSRKVLVLIKTDPMKSHRAVEALRIAVGLGSHNEGKDITIILSGLSPFLLAEDTSDVVDTEILEKYLPTLAEWHTPLAIAFDAETPVRYAPGLTIKPLTEAEIAAQAGADAAIALGLAPVESLNAFIESCEKLGIDAMIDMMRS